MGILGQSLESTITQDVNPHKKGCYTYTPCKFAEGSTAIFRLDEAPKGVIQQSSDKDPRPSMCIRTFGQFTSWQQ